jgi:hypothetical protein
VLHVDAWRWGCWADRQVRQRIGERRNTYPLNASSQWLLSGGLRTPKYCQSRWVSTSESMSDCVPRMFLVLFIVADVNLQCLGIPIAATDMRAWVVPAYEV